MSAESIGLVYAKPPFGSAEQVVHYVGRYTHRVAISNSRVIDIEDGKVRFRWQDYRQGSKQKVMTLDVGEFIRRFLIHVLPEGFKRIRYYGFLGNRYRKQKLARCRELLGMISADAHSEPEEPSDCPEKPEHRNAASLRLCPSCHQGHMVCIEVLEPGSFSAARSPDTS